jgi:hypothetical protein
MVILKDDSYHMEVANSVLMNYDVLVARRFGHMEEDHYSEGSGLDGD